MVVREALRGIKFVKPLVVFHSLPLLILVYARHLAVLRVSLLSLEKREVLGLLPAAQARLAFLDVKLVHGLVLHQMPLLLCLICASVIEIDQSRIVRVDAREGFERVFPVRHDAASLATLEGLIRLQKQLSPRSLVWGVLLVREYCLLH